MDFILPEGVVAFDLETTGLSPLFDKVIEIGAVKRLPDGNTSHFQELVRPGIPIPPENSLIHGITDDQVASAPPIQEVLPRFLRFIGDLPLVAHNARFDTGFLVFALRQQGLPLPDNAIYCSLSLSRSVFQEVPNNRLETLAQRLSIPYHRHHRAWDDASICLQLVLRALEHSGEKAEAIWENPDFITWMNSKASPPSPNTSPDWGNPSPPDNPWISSIRGAAPRVHGAPSPLNPFSPCLGGTSCTLSVTVPGNTNTFFSTKFKISEIFHPSLDKM